MLVYHMSGKLPQKKKVYRCKERRNGILYVYERPRIYDSEKKRYKNDSARRPKCLGRIDEETGKLIPRSTTAGANSIAAIEPVLPTEKLLAQIEATIASGDTAKALSKEMVGIASETSLRMLVRWIGRDAPDVFESHSSAGELIRAGERIGEHPIELGSYRIPENESHFEYWSFNYSGNVAKVVEGTASDDYIVKGRENIRANMFFAFDTQTSAIARTHLALGTDAERKIPSPDKRGTWFAEQSDSQPRSSLRGDSPKGVVSVYWRDRPGMVVPSAIYKEEVNAIPPREALASVMKRVLGLIVCEFEELTPAFLAERKYGNEFKREEKLQLLRGIALSGFGLIMGLQRVSTEIFGFDRGTGILELLSQLDGVYRITDDSGNNKIVAGEAMQDWIEKA